MVVHWTWRRHHRRFEPVGLHLVLDRALSNWHLYTREPRFRRRSCRTWSQVAVFWLEGRRWQRGYWISWLESVFAATVAWQASFGGHLVEGPFASVGIQCWKVVARLEFDASKKVVAALAWVVVATDLSRRRFVLVKVVLVVYVRWVS